MVIWKFLHIVSMFAAVTLFFAYEIVMHRAGSAADVVALRRIGAQRKRVEDIAVPVFFSGIAFGIVTAVQGEIDLTAPWLIVTYVLVVILIGLGAAVESPYLGQLYDAAGQDEGGTMSTELRALLADPRRHLMWVSAVLYGAVIYMMVVKPFS